MICCFDVHYKPNDTAVIGCVIFERWTDESPVSSQSIVHKGLHEYISGQFYKRELPCLLTAFEQLHHSIDLIVIDGYVWLDGDHKGLGHYLFDALNQKTPVVGIAKKHFKGVEGNAIEITRGDSNTPLFITSIGVDKVWASGQVKAMHGTYRLPTLIKLADSCSRVEVEE